MNSPKTQTSKTSARQFRKRCLWSTGVLLICVLFVALVPVLFSSGQDRPWRYTKDGWVDASEWYQPEPVPFERRIELVHPGAMASILLLSAVGMLLWSAEEWEVAYLLEGKASVCRRSQPRPPTINDYL